MPAMSMTSALRRHTQWQSTLIVQVIHVTAYETFFEFIRFEKINETTIGEIER